VVLTSPQVRRHERERRLRFLEFKGKYGTILGHRLNSGAGEQGKALIWSVGVPGVEMELGLVKALEMAGFEPVVLIRYGQELLRGYYHLAGVKKIYSWEKFSPVVNLSAAERIIDRYSSVKELLAFESSGVRVGRSAAATMLRSRRLGCLDLRSPHVREVLVKYLASAMRSAEAAQRIIQKVHAKLALFIDATYTPGAELVDVCLLNGIDTIVWEDAHKSNSIMLKRYTMGNREENPRSLSSGSWRLLRDMEWTDACRLRLEQELYSCYASGDWYSHAGTQYNKRLIPAADTRKQLGLDPSKKNAFIFPHILWDASFLFGKDLFGNYEEWLIETVRAACANDRVNWVIKIHPAHVGRRVQEGHQGEPAEVVVLRRHIGELPPHIFMIPAESHISTFSLFELMDYCLTVRGTIGIEAASFGIPVLTAGTGRYDRKGFTIDSDTCEQYLERVAHIQEISRLSLAQRELAERFAYTTFVLRPLALKTMTLEYVDETGINKTEFTIGAKEDWYSAPDLTAFARWATDSNDQDFLMPLPQ